MSLNVSETSRNGWRRSRKVRMMLLMKKKKRFDERGLGRRDDSWDSKGQSVC